MDEKRKTERGRDDKEQSARFVETAREREADESGRSFARAFKTLVPKRAGKKKKSNRA